MRNVRSLFTDSAVASAYGSRGRSSRSGSMRTANYIFSVTSIVLGIAMLLFMWSQKGMPDSVSMLLPWEWHIGVAIGALLLINGAVRLWFAQDDH
jgi:hypothetical protein